MSILQCTYVDTLYTYMPQNTEPCTRGVLPCVC